MRSIRPPPDDSVAVFDLCNSRLRDLGLKRRLDLIRPSIKAAADRFAAACVDQQLSTFPASHGVDGVSHEEMLDTYTSRMAAKGSPGRPIYDRLMNAAQRGLCPLCAQRVVSTLDHHLPKSVYDVLAVVPNNLVPSCFDCNKAKSASVAASEEEQPLNPYFDDVSTDCWLVATIIEQRPTAVVFSCQPPSTWSALKSARTQHHFRSLRLGALYSLHAGEELMNVRHYLCQLHGLPGPSTVREHLLRQAQSYSAVDQNSWQSAMYRALAANEWYYGGGFVPQ